MYSPLYKIERRLREIGGEPHKNEPFITWSERINQGILNFSHWNICLNIISNYVLTLPVLDILSKGILKIWLSDD